MQLLEVSCWSESFSRVWSSFGTNFQPFLGSAPERPEDSRGWFLQGFGRAESSRDKEKA